MIAFSHDHEFFITLHSSSSMTTRYLTLGDGDMTYSLDLCRFLKAKTQLDKSTTTCTRNETDLEKIEVICSGIDSKENLLSKYKDGAFILKQIENLNDTNYDLSYDHFDSKGEKCSSHTSSLLLNQPAAKRSRFDTSCPIGDEHLFSVKIRHEVNAIQAWDENSEQIQVQVQVQPQQESKSSDSNSIQWNQFDSKCSETYHHVIFNHPHLGQENATLHSQFLSHFFHSCATKWLSSRNPMSNSNDPKSIDTNDNPCRSCKTSGIVHLTLAMGQCERWKCIKNAEKHGLVLLHRDAFQFIPHPKYVHLVQQSSGANNHLGVKVNSTNTATTTNTVTTEKIDYQQDTTTGTYYQLRRHQSGKSFASRIKDGSETLTFGRKCDIGYHVANHLLWQTIDQTLLPRQQLHCDHPSKDSRIQESSLRLFQCDHCFKSFKDERGRKNHVLSVHSNDNMVDSDNVNNNKRSLLICDICHPNVTKSDDGTNNTIRIFSNQMALDAHKIAKHSGKNVDIKPEWSIASKSISDDSFRLKDITTDAVSEVIQCQICDKVFATMEEERNHYKDFIPSNLISESNSLVEGIQDRVVFSCTFCDKKFTQRRAKLQHENFCSLNNIGCSNVN